MSSDFSPRKCERTKGRKNGTHSTNTPFFRDFALSRFRGKKRRMRTAEHAMTTFATAYLIVWFTMTAYVVLLAARQRRMSHLLDGEAPKPCC
jgi:CcmD family protein